ncbi:MAG: glycogen debranching N-terminal domain-containing protein [Actinomycetota bacterium]
MEPNEIFELIIKADERLKYAKPEQLSNRRRQARELLVQAREEASAIGNDALVGQADTRLADLDAAPDGPSPIAGGSDELSAVPYLVTPSSATGHDRPMRHEPSPDGPRPTPADPLPGEAEAAGVPSAKRDKAPPELGNDAIAILEGRTFMYSDERGDVPAGSVGGLVHNDTRFLSTWLFTVNGVAPTVLRSHTVDYYSASFFLANPQLPGLPQNTLAIRRQRFVGDGVRENITVHSYAHEPVQVEIRLAAGVDFADLSEMKAAVRDRSAETTVEVEEPNRSIVFRYEHDGFRAETHLHTESVCEFQGTDLVWHATIAPNDHWRTELRVRVTAGGQVLEPSHGRFGEERDLAEDDPLVLWMDSVPRFSSESPC